MAVLTMPVSGVFRHPVDGAHAAQVLREKGFSTIAISPIAETIQMRREDRKMRPRVAAGIGFAVVAVAAGYIAGQGINKVVGMIAGMTVIFFGLLWAILFLNWGAPPVTRYPRRNGVLLTVQCRSGQEPEVEETLRHAGAVKINT
jgi:hypothetical protein